MEIPQPWGLPLPPCPAREGFQSGEPKMSGGSGEPKEGKATSCTLRCGFRPAFLLEALPGGHSDRRFGAPARAVLFGRGVERGLHGGPPSVIPETIWPLRDLLYGAPVPRGPRQAASRVRARPQPPPPGASPRPVTSKGPQKGVMGRGSPNAPQRPHPRSLPRLKNLRRSSCVSTDSLPASPPRPLPPTHAQRARTGAG